MKSSFSGYGTEYYENLLEMYAASMEKINSIRWNFVAEIKHELVLDYGSGPGAFGLWRPNGSILDSYDIGRIGDAPYPQTGIRHERYDLVCFWDVLEHVDWRNNPDKDILDIFTRTAAVAATVPILPRDKYPDGADISDWKHYKPGEHLTYYDVDSFIEFMSQHGFTMIKHGQPECPPRIDIHSFLLVKDDGQTA